MTWKTTNIHLMKGNVMAVYGDSALFFWVKPTRVSVNLQENKTHYLLNSLHKNIED
jgi:hypothetical protein